MSEEDNMVYDEDSHDAMVDDVMHEDATTPMAPPVTDAPSGVAGMSTKQILLCLQGVVVLVIVLIIIIMVLCKPKKKDEKKHEDTNYPSVEQVCEEHKETRTQVTLRKTAGTEESSEC